MHTSHPTHLTAQPDCVQMKLANPPAASRPARCDFTRAGFSLLELVFGMFLLGSVALGITAALLQSRKLSESNLVQAYAEVTAQSIVEQLVSQPYTVLSAPAAEVPGLTIKLPGLSSTNRTTMDDFTIPWAANESTFTDLGTPEDPDRGILMDAAYIRESNTIHAERYLPMRVCLVREISGSSSERRVLLTLRYQWAVPDRRGNGTPIYLTGEFRTARSSASSF